MRQALGTGGNEEVISRTLIVSLLLGWNAGDAHAALSGGKAPTCGVRTAMGGAGTPTITPVQLRGFSKQLAFVLLRDDGVFLSLHEPPRGRATSRQLQFNRLLLVNRKSPTRWDTVHVEQIHPVSFEASNLSFVVRERHGKVSLFLPETPPGLRPAHHDIYSQVIIDTEDYFASKDIEQTWVWYSPDPKDAGKIGLYYKLANREIFEGVIRIGNPDTQALWEWVAPPRSLVKIQGREDYTFHPVWFGKMVAVSSKGDINVVARNRKTLDWRGRVDGSSLEVFDAFLPDGEKSAPIVWMTERPADESTDAHEISVSIWSEHFAKGLTSEKIGSLSSVPGIDVKTSKLRTAQVIANARMPGFENTVFLVNFVPASLPAFYQSFLLPLKMQGSRMSLSTGLRFDIDKPYTFHTYTPEVNEIHPVPANLVAASQQDFVLSLETVRQVLLERLNEFLVHKRRSQVNHRSLSLVLSKLNAGAILDFTHLRLKFSARAEELELYFDTQTMNLLRVIGWNPFMRRRDYDHNRAARIKAMLDMPLGPLRALLAKRAARRSPSEERLVGLTSYLLQHARTHLFNYDALPYIDVIDVLRSIAPPAYQDSLTIGQALVSYVALVDPLVGISSTPELQQFLESTIDSGGSR